MSEEEVRGIISAEVAEAIREVTSELFGMIKTTMIELFEDHHVAFFDVVVVVATATIGIRGKRAF